MFEKFAEDVVKRYQEKLATLEKTASKWAREMVKRFGDRFTIGDYRKMFNAAYNTENNVTLSNLKRAPENFKSPKNYQSQYKDRIEQLTENIRNKIRNSDNMSPEREAMYEKILSNYRKLKGSTSGPFKEEFREYHMNEALPASKYFDFTDSLLNSDMADKIKGIATPQSVAKTFRRAGGKNPVIKGLKSKSIIKNTNASRNGRPTYFADNKALAALKSGPEKEILKNLKGESDLNEPVTFFSGLGPVADMYSYGNYSVANLDNIIEDLKKEGIEFSANIGSFNPKYRKEFNDKVMELYGMPLHKILQHKINDPNLWRKSEIAIPERMVEKLNPQGFHVFDPTSDFINPRPFTYGTLMQDDHRNLSKGNLKNFLKTKRAKELQAIPIEDYNRGRKEIEGSIKNNIDMANSTEEQLFPWAFKYNSFYDYRDLLKQIGINMDNIKWMRPYIR